MDFDPRDYDSRDDDRLAFGHQRGDRGTSHDDVDRDDDLKLPETRSRDRDETEHATSVAGQATPDSRVAMDTIRGTTRGGPSATAIRVTRSRAI
jgi:hypothetical protein